MIEINITNDERDVLLMELLNRKQRLVRSFERQEQLQEKRMTEIKETEKLVNKILDKNKVSIITKSISPDEMTLGY